MKTIKILVLTISLTCIHLLSAQIIQFEITGSVIEKESKLPIDDVLIIINNEIIGHTNDKGEFNLGFYTEKNDSIKFNHFSYKSVNFSLKELKTPIIIELTEKIIQLNEVVIGDNEKVISEKKIIKQVIKKHKKSYRKEPYWSSVNIVQTTSLNDTLPAFLEIDGNIFMSGGGDKNVWNYPILVPSESRRTKELFIKFDNNPLIQKINEEKPYSHLGLFYIQDLLFLSYRFFEFAHPLNTKGYSRYDFIFDDVTEISGEDYYTINYKSKKGINRIKGRDFHSIRGQLFISIKDLTLKKITYLSTRGNSIDNIFTVHYDKIDNIIYPKNLFYDLEFKWAETKNTNTINSKGILRFNNINTIPVDNYRNTISSNRYLFMYHKIHNNYNPTYWVERNPTNMRLHNDILKIFNNKFDNSRFDEGNLQKIKIISEYQDIEEKIIKIMKNDCDK